MNKENVLLEGSIKKTYVSYLIPTIIGMLTNSVYCLVDVMFVGKYVGSQGLAALNIAMPIFTIFSAVGLMFGVGGATTISIFIGQRDKETVNKVFTFTMIICFAVGLLFSVFGTIFLKEFAIILGATPTLLPAVMDYLRPLVITSVLFVVNCGMQVIVRADYNPKLVMISTVVSNGLNIFFDYYFVSVKGWGLTGAALATAIGPIVGVLILAFHYICKKNTMHFNKDFMHVILLRRVIQNGSGTFILEFSAGVVIFLFNFVLLRVGGEDAVAVYAIISNIAYVGKGVFNGIAQAAQPLISVNYGAKQMERCNHSFKLACKITIIFATLSYFIILIFPGTIIGFFVNSGSDILDNGAVAARIYFFSFIFTGINTMLMYYFQSIEKIRLTIIVSICRGFLFIVVGLAIFPFLLQETGVWITVTFAEVITLIFALRGKKQIDKSIMEHEMASKE